MEIMMNIFFRKGTSNSESNSTKDDSEVINCKESKSENDDDDDVLILTSTDNDKQTKNPTLLTQTVQQLFGRTSASINQSNIPNNTTDEKMIIDPNNTDDQLIDLN
jgi:hypothetical protein